MKMTVYILCLFFTVYCTGNGQSLEGLLQNVKQDNLQISALQKWLESEEVKSNTGIYPENPEVNFNYLFGNPETIGNQQELEIIQSFKMPGYYTSKSAVQKLDFQQKQVMADKEIKAILHSARMAYFKLVWLYKKESILKNRKNDIEKWVERMKMGFEGGEISKPAFDKSRIYAIGVQAEWQKVLSEIEIQHHYISQLNGGNTIAGLTFEYPFDWKLPGPDTLLTRLYDNNPDLEMARLHIQISEKEQKYQRMNSMPTFEAGYKSESITGQQLQGFHAGINIPLWHNKNNVKYARLSTETSEANYLHFENEMKTMVSTLYLEVAALQAKLEQIKQILEEGRASESGLELLESGQISFTDFVIETEMVFETRMRYLENERDFFTGLSRLLVLTE